MQIGLKTIDACVLIISELLRSHVAEKIKDTLEKKVYEKQLELEFERPIEQGA